LHFYHSQLLHDCLELTRKNHGQDLAIDVCYDIKRKHPEIEVFRCQSAIRRECAKLGLEVDVCRISLAHAESIQSGNQPSTSGPDAVDSLVTDAGEVLDGALNAAAIAAGTVLAAGVVVFSVAAAMEPEIIIVFW
jgi:hypothetical protein